MIQFCIRAVPAAHKYVSEGRLRTLGSPLFSLLLQAQGGPAPDSTVASKTSIIRLVLESSPLSKGVLTLLAILSIVSWGIILYKLWTYRSAEKDSVQFLEVFRRSNKFSEVQAVCRSLGESPLVGLFQSGYAELTAQLRQRFDVFRAHWQMMDGYEPEPSPAVQAPTLIVSANDSPNAPTRDLWPNVLAGPVTTLPIDGDHYTFLRPPTVAKVAVSIKQASEST